MDRRNVLKLAATGALAFFVDVGTLEPKEALAFAEKVKRTYPIRRSVDGVLRLRKGTSAGPSIHDSHAPREPGTVYLEFNESWDQLAEMKDFETPKRLITRTPTGRKFSITSVGHSLNDPDNDKADMAVVIVEGDWSVIRLQRLDHLHIWYSECDFVIAETAEHAARLFLESTAAPTPVRGKLEVACMLDEATYFEPGDGTQAQDWQMWPDDKLFPFWEELEVPLDSRTLALQEDEGFRWAHHGGLAIRRNNDLEVYGSPVREPIRKPRVLYEVWKDEMIYKKQSRKLPAEWIEQFKLGYFGSTEY